MFPFFAVTLNSVPTSSFSKFKSPPLELSEISPCTANDETSTVSFVVLTVIPDNPSGKATTILRYSAAGFVPM